jgi:hypothetical protein
VYTPTLGLNELNPRYYQVFRRRVGFTGAFDFKQSNDSAFTIRSVFNRFIDDHENRQRMRDWSPTAASTANCAIGPTSSASPRSASRARGSRARRRSTTSSWGRTRIRPIHSR